MRDSNVTPIGGAPNPERLVAEQVAQEAFANKVLGVVAPHLHQLGQQLGALQGALLRQRFELETERGLRRMKVPETGAAPLPLYGEQQLYLEQRATRRELERRPDRRPLLFTGPQQPAVTHLGEFVVGAVVDEDDDGVEATVLVSADAPDFLAPLDGHVFTAGRKKVGEALRAANAAVEELLAAERERVTDKGEPQ